MGFLTTFTIYNDGIDLVKKYSKEFADIIDYASSKEKTEEYGLGNHCNLIKAQKTRHADDNTIYVHCGNTVSEMNPFSDDTKNLMINHPEFFEQLLHEMEYSVKKLKKQYNEHKNQNK